MIDCTEPHLAVPGPGRDREGQESMTKAVQR